MSTSATATTSGICIRTVQRWLRKYGSGSEFRRTIDSSLIETGNHTMGNNKVCISCANRTQYAAGVKHDDFFTE